MKKYLFTFALISFLGIQHTQAQQILDSLIGKWNVKEYHNNRKKISDTGIVEFRQDGFFISSNTYFGETKGLFRTDETRAVVYFDNQKTSEWKAILKNKTLRLEKIANKRKTATIYLILERDESIENQQVIN